jgi:hypothetical protein
MRVKYHDNPLLPLNSRRMSQVASTGLCQSNDLLLVGGINVAPICTGLHPFTEGNWTGINTFYVGLAAGSGAGGSLTLPLSLFGVAPIPAWGWNWALDDQINGVTMSEIFARMEP